MKIGMLFPGYGSQFVGMGKDLYDESRIMQEYFEEAANCLDINFVKLCFASSDVELAQMENAFPSIFLISTSLHAILKEQGIHPTVVAGYNTGEYAAVYAAGGFSLPDGLYLLEKYHEYYRALLNDLDVAGVQIIGVPTDEVKALCQEAARGDQYVSIAFYDSALQHTIMGHTKAIDTIRRKLIDNKGVDLDDVPLEVGLHSMLMDPVAANIKIYQEKVDFKLLTCPLITNADARMMTEGDLVKSALVKQIHSPVLWHNIVEQLSDCDVVIEVGPGTYLSNTVQKHYPEKKCMSFNKMSDLEEIKKIIEA